MHILETVLCYPNEKSRYATSVVFAGLSQVVSLCKKMLNAFFLDNKRSVFIIYLRNSDHHRYMFEG